MTASRKAYEGSVSYDESHPGYTQPEASYAREDYEPLQEEEDDGSVTPTMDHPRLEPDMIIRGTQGKYEDLDARYCVESSHKFQPGEVFKILWSEPQGQSTRHNSTSRVNLETYTEKIQLENDWGEPFYVGFRRFIVVANDEGHCTCIPILTYIRQGCKKKGAKPAKHGIIHEFGTKPRPLEGEPPLGFKPIRLEIKAAGERLARESRVNYSKLVTVEHNVKVFFIGNIQPDDFDNVVPHAVDTCWQGKIRKRVKKGLANVPRH
ncbi:hypothetical protein BR93DRAFT_510170 [Coniochaeta sp. PMI_546]|nr:hypothetical protein BR93DRAFT_510170 [Coniochaeta sp. PMI_546]